MSTSRDIPINPARAEALLATLHRARALAQDVFADRCASKQQREEAMCFLADTDSLVAP